jgi:biopolymer transport protein TolQ
MIFRSGLGEFLGTLGIVSQIVLFVLLVFSVVSWTIILYKWRLFRDQEAADQRFLDAFSKYGYPLEASREIRLHKSSGVAAVYAEVTSCYPLAANGDDGAPLGLVSSGDGGEGVPTQNYVERVMGHAIQEQITRTEAYLPFLATTGNITPFIGLLGTVLGIIDAFHEIGVQGTASIAAVAPGVAEALVATAAGLFTAIPAVIAYNYFLARVRKMAFRLDRFAIELTNALDRRGIGESAGRP